MSVVVGARFTYYAHSTFLITTDGGTNLLLDPWIWLPERDADVDVLEVTPGGSVD